MNAHQVPPARVVFDEQDRKQVLELVDRALQSGTLTIGPITEELEARFAAAHRASHAVATNSGTSALEILLRAVGIAGSKVVVPTNTFYATAAAVLHAGAIPRFADVDPATLALSAASVEAALDPEVRAVVHVHIGGAISPQIETIRALCEERGLVLIEDAAHAHGSLLSDKPAGWWSSGAAFSFYPTKVVAGAEGGMILTSEEGLRDEARMYRDQGKSSFLSGAHVRLGSAWRMSEVQAAVALVQLSRMEERIARRRQVAAAYDRGLAGLEALRPLGEPQGSRSNYYKYIAVLDRGIDRQALKATLREHYSVGMSGEVYATPLHREPVFAGLAEGPLPVAEDLCARHVCLPVHSDMTDAEVNQVLDALHAVLGDPPR